MEIIMNDFQKTAKEMLDFIEKSPTCFHAVANIGAMLEEAGYVRLRENEEWKLKRVENIIRSAMILP